MNALTTGFPMRRIFCTVSLLPLLAACAIGPDYEAPSMAVGGQFTSGASTSLADPSQERWWTGFRDPLLNEFVSRGLEQNLDIQAALSRIDQAEAQLRTTGVNADLSGSFSASNTSSGQFGSSSTSSTTANLSASYVLDFFGSSKRTQQQAIASLEKAGFDAGAARLAFLTSLTTNYMTARFNQEAIAYTRETIASREQTLSLVSQQVDAGAASQLDLVQSRANLESAQADLPSYASGFERAVFAIATLLAEKPSEVMARMQKGAPQPLPGAVDRTGVPADLMRNIPSVRSAERDLYSAVAAVGISEAALYPSISLSGTISENSANDWSFGPSLSLPIFNQGLLRAQRDANIAAAEQAEIAWRSAVLDAVEDVEASAAAVKRSRETLAALRKVVASNDEALELSRQTYEAGALALLDLLETERNTSSQRLSLASAKRDLANNWISLQIATGRGWNPK